MKQIPEAALLGLVEAAWEALRDAEKEEPTAPFKKGDLRGSADVQESKDLFDLFVEFGFNIEYAAYQHELPGQRYKNPTTPGSGPKFLESKLIRFRDKYYEIIAEAIKDEQGRV